MRLSGNRHGFSREIRGENTLCQRLRKKKEKRPEVDGAVFGRFQVSHQSHIMHEVYVVEVCEVQSVERAAVIMVLFATDGGGR